MTSKQLSKRKSQTPDTNKPIDTVIADRRQELLELAASLSIYMMSPQLPSTAAKVNELQDRLEFRTKQYEAELLREKVDIYQECLKLVKPR